MNQKEEILLEAALDLFYKKGFHGASTASIAKQAGVSNGILFHYFKSKDVLIQKLHAHLKDEQILALSKGLDDASNPKDQLHLVWSQTIAWAINNKIKYHFLHQYKYSPYREKHKGEMEKFSKKFAEVVEKGVHQKLLKYLPEDFIFDVTNANAYGMIEYLTNNPVKYRTPEFMKRAFESFWDSIKA